MVRRFKRREWGGMAMIMTFVVITMATLFLAVLTLGFMADRRQRLQAAADAIVSVDIWDVLTRPRVTRSVPSWSLGNPALLIDGNTADNVAANVAIAGRSRTWTEDLRNSVAYTDVTLTDSNLLPLATDGATFGLTVNARAQVASRALPAPVDRIPQMVLVLDYSRSMDLRATDSPGLAIQDLVRVVGQFADGDAARFASGVGYFDLGAVLYSQGVLPPSPVPAAAPTAGQVASIKGAMARNTASGLGNMASALLSARMLLAAKADNTGRYVLLITDGAPEDPTPTTAQQNARAMATTLWDIDAEIFTIEIARQGSTAALTDFLISISGSADRPQDPGHYRMVTQASDLMALLLGDTTLDIWCDSGPVRDPNTGVGPRQDEPLYMYALANTGTETSIPQVFVREQLADPTPGLGGPEYLRFYFDYNTAMATFSQDVCTRIKSGNSALRARYGLPRLACGTGPC